MGYAELRLEALKLAFQFYDTNPPDEDLTVEHVVAGAEAFFAFLITDEKAETEH